VNFVISLRLQKVGVGIVAQSVMSCVARLEAGVARDQNDWRSGISPKGDIVFEAAGYASLTLFLVANTQIDRPRYTREQGHERRLEVVFDVESRDGTMAIEPAKKVGKNVRFRRKMWLSSVSQANQTGGSVPFSMGGTK